MLMVQHKFIFKPCLTDLNSEISLSYTGCSEKVKQPSLPCNIPVARGTIIGFDAFRKCICAMRNGNKKLEFNGIAAFEFRFFLFQAKAKKKQNKTVSPIHRYIKNCCILTVHV